MNSKHKLEYRFNKIRESLHIVVKIYNPHWIRLGGSYLRNEQVNLYSSKEEMQDHFKRKGTYLSDIDFAIDSGINESIIGIDIRYALPGSIEVWNKEKGLIMWDFTKLDAQGAKKAKEAYDNTDYKALMDIHNEYQLSNENYTCQCQSRQVYDWWKHGFDNDLIVISYEEITN